MGPWQKVLGWSDGPKTVRIRVPGKASQESQSSAVRSFLPQWPEWSNFYTATAGNQHPAGLLFALSSFPLSLYFWLLLLHLSVPLFLSFLFLCHFCPLMSFPQRISFFLCSRWEEASYQASLAECLWAWRLTQHFVACLLEGWDPLTGPQTPSFPSSSKPAPLTDESCGWSQEKPGKGDQGSLENMCASICSLLVL